MKTCAFVALVACSVLPARAADLDAVAKDIVGGWRLEFTSPDQVKRTPTVIVGRQRDELVAWYVENDRPEAFKEVRLADDTLLLTFAPQERNGDVTVTFEAKLKGEGACGGQAKYTTKDGDSGSWEFSGKRVTPSDFDEVSQWGLSFVAPDEQQREATVTVLTKGDRRYGWFSSEDYDVPAKSLTVEDDGVSLAISVKGPNGSNVDVTFRGTVSGDRVEGKAEYSFEGESGSFPFTGKRKS
jgi:hypothetical protein